MSQSAKTSRKFGWHSGTLTARDVQVKNDLYIENNLVFKDVSFGALDVTGRLSTGSIAGAAIDIDSDYAYGQGWELRWQVTDWTNVGSTFDGMYLRSEASTNSAAGKNIRGTQIYGVCNNVTMTTGSLWGTLTYAYVKGTGAVTINKMYAGQFELSWDASRTADCTISTEAAVLLAKVTGGRVDDYTNIHGMIIRFGEMDADSQTFGNGILLEDDSEMVGTSTFTTGINVGIGCTSAIAVTAVQTDETGLDEACVFKHGTYSTSLAYGTQTTTHLVLKSTCITAASTGYYVFGDILRITSSATSTGHLVGTYTYISLGHTTNNTYAIRGRVDVTATAELGLTNALMAEVNIDAGTITTGSGGSINGLHVDMNMAGGTATNEIHGILVDTAGMTVNTSGDIIGLKIAHSGGSNYMDYGIQITNELSTCTAAIHIMSTQGSCPIGIKFESGNGHIMTSAITLTDRIQYCFDFNNATDTFGFTKTTSEKTGSVVGLMHVKDQDGSAAYINVYA